MNAAPRVTPFEFASTDGYPLGGHWIRPIGGGSGPVTVIHSATAVPQGYYALYASHLAARGHRVMTYDYRGIGASRRGSLRRAQISMDDWLLRDFRAACDVAKAEAGDDPLVYVGHSVGGHAMLRTGALHEPVAAVTVGTGSGYHRLAPPRQRPMRRLQMQVIMPAVARTMGYLPGWMGLSEDLPGGVTLEWARRCCTPGYFSPEERAHITNIYKGLKVPGLHLSFSDDTYISTAATADLLSLLPSSSATLKVIDPKEIGASEVGHFKGFRSAGRPVWAMIDEFVDRQLCC